MDEFIKRLKSRGLYLEVSDDDLILKSLTKSGGKNAFRQMPDKDEIIHFIKTNKSSLKAYLQTSKKEHSGKRELKKQATYRLTPLQEGMLFHGLYSEGTGDYIKQVITDFDEEIDLYILQETWKYLIRKHSVLRSAFFYDEADVPVQCVYEGIEMPTEQIDFSNYGKEEQQRKIQAFLNEDKAKGFPFDIVPLMRTTIIKTDQNSYKMIWSYHHILMDGWSNELLINEFASVFSSYCRNEKVISSGFDLFEDYIKYIAKKDARDEEEFWKSYIRDVSTPSLLPFINKTANERNKGGGHIIDLKRKFSRSFSEELKSYARRHQLTVNSVMQATWSLLLAEYTGNNEVIFGVIVSGRPPELPNIEEKVGLFINTIPLRARIRYETSIVHWITELQRSHIHSREYQYSSLANIQRWSEIPGDLFDSIMVYENYPTLHEASESQFEDESFGVTQQTNYPLTVNVIVKSQLEVKFTYNKSLIAPYYMDLIQQHFEHLLRQIISEEKEQIGELEIITADEKRQVLDVFNKKVSTQADRVRLIDLFKDQVKKSPTITAVVFQGTTLSFEELNKKSEEFARFLHSQYQLDVGEVVAVHLSNSEWTAISLIAILKLGATYTPIDPENTRERIDYLVQDSKSKLILDKELIQQFVRFEGDFGSTPSENSANEITLINYTSGSTGKPKGVVLTHDNVMNRLQWMWDEFPLEEEDVCCMRSSIGFVDHLWELFGALLRGRTLVIYSKQDVLELDSFMQSLAKHQVTRITVVPSLLREMLAHDHAILLENIRIWTCGGEALPYALLEQFFKTYHGKTLLNVYGSTEVSDAATCQAYQYAHEGMTAEDTFFQENGSVSIGKPIRDSSLFILNERHQLLPVGVPGEIYVGGAGVSQGYWGDEKLTKEKFHINPFQDLGDQIYKTGDIGKWLPDGALDFFGRSDRQIKINGVRVELREVERIISDIKGVSQCVTLAISETPSDQPQIVAYVVKKDDTSEESLYSKIRSNTPVYMRPSSIHFLDVIPRNASGKVDQYQLPRSVSGATLTSEYIPASNDVELCVQKIWSKVLRKKEVSVEDHFFELGGDSIKAIQVAARSKKSNYPFTVKNLFDHPTIRQLASSLLAVEPVSLQQEKKIIFTPTQRRILQKRQLVGHGVNIIRSFKLALDLSLVDLKASVKQLLNKHAVLRTQIQSTVTGTINEMITETNIGEYWFEEKSKGEGQERHMDEIAKEKSRRTIWQDIPLVSFHYFHANEGSRLLVVTDEVIMDSFSWGILVKDLNDKCVPTKNAEVKTTSGDTFQHWSEQWNHYIGDIANEKPEQEHVEKYHDEEKSQVDFLNRVYNFSPFVSQSLLQEANEAYGTTEDELLISILKMSFDKCSIGQELSIAIQKNGRFVDVFQGYYDRTIGHFGYQYPIDIPHGHTIADQIKATKESLRQILQHELEHGQLIDQHRAENRLLLDLSGNFTIESGAITFDRDLEVGVPDDRFSLILSKQLVKGNLCLEINAQKNKVRGEQLDELISSINESAEQLVQFCLKQESTELTPSDFGYDDLTSSDLDTISSLLN